jgi:hypothetical protein
MEVGSDTSTIALRVIGDDEKGTQCWGYDWQPGLTGWESLEYERVKYVHESHGTCTQE